ncbi:hypothetical protein [Janthinobacterium sp. B9-8]|uniref:hypothetical protein n=1 Tax=Janthinobacterium sp. B9-8 TaxID=1236179 RepID=UPI00061D3A64|nr:hypothetical protein [Janthinobacterium sp. B9-8]AMC35636.1 hypothetical protein VN23_13925 [Janthinobacterium sp. B9-8]
MLARPTPLPADIDRLIASADEILHRQANEGLPLARHALMQAKSIGYIQGEARAGLLLGSAQLILGQQQAALATFQQALTIAQASSLEKSNLLEQMARSHHDLGDTPQAAKIWGECAQIALENQHFTVFIQAQIGLGQVHFGFEEYELALQCHYKAFDFLYTSKDPVLRCQVYINIVMDLYSLARLSEAETMLQRARDISLTIRHLDNESEIYRISGLLLLQQGSIENARTNFASALKICLLQENPWHKAMSLLGLAHCDLTGQLWHNARVQLDEALTLATQLQNPHLLCKTHHGLMLACTGLKENAAAKTHEMAFTQYKKMLQRPN